MNKIKFNSPKPCHVKFSNKSKVFVAIMVFCFFATLCYADEATSYVNRGVEAVADRHYGSAIANFDKAIELSTNYAYAYYGRGIAFYKKAQYEAAISNFCQAISFDSAGNITHDALLMRGNSYGCLGKYDAAIRDFTTVINNDSRNPTNYINRGDAYLMIYKFDLAKNDFSETLKLDPTNADAYFGKASAERCIGDFDLAIQDYNKVLDLVSNSGPTYLEWAALNGKVISHTAKKDYLSALADNNKIIQIYSDDVSAVAVRGFLLSKAGRFEEGIGECKRAVKLDPNSILANNNLAWLLATAPDAKLRNGPAAVEYAKKACDLTHWQESIYLGTLAAAYAETGNYSEAVKWQQKAIALGFSKDDLIEAKKYLDLYKNNKPFHAEAFEPTSQQL